jgi:hypothetical protein
MFNPWRFWVNKVRLACKIAQRQPGRTRGGRIAGRKH